MHQRQNLASHLYRAFCRHRLVCYDLALEELMKGRERHEEEDEEVRG